MKTGIYIILILVFTAPLAYSQSRNTERVSFAVLGGVNFQNINGKDVTGDKLVNDLIIGYHAGVNVQIPFAPQICFQPGLLFTTKGTKAIDGLLTRNFRISYLEIPLNVVYKATLGNGSLMIGFGPYLAYGIGGMVTTEGGPVTIETDIEFKNVVETGDPLSVAYFRAFDVGGNIFAGYELAGGIFAQLNTQFGMFKINPEDRIITADKTSLKNTGFGLSIGYRF